LGATKAIYRSQPITYEGREPNAPWRMEAEQRIDKFRKANLTVRVSDVNGRPVAGAKVHVRQLSHAYEFGSFIEEPLLWDNEDGRHYRDWFLRAYNKATTPMYWADWGWENDKSYADSCRTANGLKPTASARKPMCSSILGGSRCLRGSRSLSKIPTDFAGA